MKRSTRNAIGTVILFGIFSFCCSLADAALFVYDQTSDTYVNWHVGDQSPVDNSNLDYEYGDAITCWATSAELAYIQANFIGIPMMTGKHVQEMSWINANCEAIINNL